MRLCASSPPAVARAARCVLRACVRVRVLTHQLRGQTDRHPPLAHHRNTTITDTGTGTGTGGRSENRTPGLLATTRRASTR